MNDNKNSKTSTISYPSYLIYRSLFFQYSSSLAQFAFQNSHPLGQRKKEIIHLLALVFVLASASTLAIWSDSNPPFLHICAPRRQLKLLSTECLYSLTCKRLQFNFLLYHKNKGKKLVKGIIYLSTLSFLYSGKPKVSMFPVCIYTIYSQLGKFKWSIKGFCANPYYNGVHRNWNAFYHFFSKAIFTKKWNVNILNINRVKRHRWNKTWKRC